MAEMTSQKLAEHESYWSLPIGGFRIIQLRLDFAFGMEIGDAQSEFSIRINTAFTLRSSEGIRDYSVERLSEIGPAMRLLNADIEDAKGFKDGRLEITFSTNIVLSVDVDPQFEAWELVSNKANGMRVVAMPGGKLAIWSDTQP
jgi:hypothetical protein